MIRLGFRGAKLGTDARLMLNAAETSVSLSWPAATDDRAVTAYLVAIDGRTVAELSSEVLTFTIDALMPAQRYAFTVRAQDAAGNESPTPLTDEVATLDLTAPLWTGAEVSVDDLTPSSVRLQWSASEDTGQLSGLIGLNDRLRARVEHPTLCRHRPPYAKHDIRDPIEATDGHGNRLYQL